MKKPHIYKITNKINGKYYYGVHNGSNTENYMGSGKLIKHAQEKHGIENFSKEILLWFDTIEEAYEYESVVVNEKMINRNNHMCYNINLGGFGGWDHVNSNGQPVSEETREKLSNAMKNYWTPEKRKEKSESRKGLKHSEETKNKISKSNIGKDNRSEKNPMFGKQHSKESRKRISQNRNYKDKYMCPYCEYTNNPSKVSMHIDKNHPNLPSWKELGTKKERKLKFLVKD